MTKQWYKIGVTGSLSSSDIFFYQNAKVILILITEEKVSWGQQSFLRKIDRLRWNKVE